MSFLYPLFERYVVATPSKFTALIFQDTIPDGLDVGCNSSTLRPDWLEVLSRVPDKFQALYLTARHACSGVWSRQGTGFEVPWSR